MIKKITAKKTNWKKTILWGCLSLAIFIASYFLANFNFAGQKENSFVSGPAVLGENDGELKELLGGADVSFLNYAQWKERYVLGSGNGAYSADPDGDGLPNYLEYAYMTNPKKADTDDDGFSDRQEIINGYDPSSKGNTRPEVEISAEKINLLAPMVWATSDDEESFQKDLESGVVNYPGGASPGQKGNLIISGHSSNYFWAKGDYKFIFQNLNDLESGDIVNIKTVQKNGRVITYDYKIKEKYVALPDEERIFEETDTPTLTLSTCWPLGFDYKRLIVKAELADGS